MKNLRKLSNQELHDELIENAGRSCSFQSKANPPVIRVFKRLGYEADCYEISPEAYASLEPLYRASMDTDGAPATTKALVDKLVVTVLRIDRLTALRSE